MRKKATWRAYTRVEDDRRPKALHKAPAVLDRHNPGIPVSMQDAPSLLHADLLSTATQPQPDGLDHPNLDTAQSRRERRQILRDRNGSFRFGNTQAIAHRHRSVICRFVPPLQRTEGRASIRI